MEKILKIKSLFKVKNQSLQISIGLLFLRLVAGSAFVLHGVSKIQTPFTWMGPESKFPIILLLLAAISEFFGGICWILGLLTPLASFGLACTMGVAVCFHVFINGDHFVGKGGSYELALVYFSIALLFILAGPGKYSLDQKIFSSSQK